MEDGKQPLSWGKGGKGKIILMAAAGIVLLLASIPTGKGKSSNTAGKSFSTYATSGDNSIAALEEKMSQALSQIQGIGKTRVVLTGTENNSVVVGEEKSEIAGALVITESGGSKQAVEQITEVMEALFDVPAHKIIVVKMKKGDVE